MHVLPIGSGKGGVGESVIAANLAIALADLDSGGSNVNGLEIGNMEDGYQETEMEAETDSQVKLGNLEELFYFGALTTGDLIEIIRSQYFELNHLKKENQLLKTKLARSADNVF